MHVRLAQALRGDLHEARFGAQILEGAAARVAHARLEPAEQLVDRLRERPGKRSALLHHAG